MSSWENLVENQHEIFTRIRDGWKNLSKLSQPNRTRDKVISRFESINTLWSTFMTNHALLVLDTRTPGDYINKAIKAQGYINEARIFVKKLFPDYAVENLNLSLVVPSTSTQAEPDSSDGENDDNLENQHNQEPNPVSITDEGTTSVTTTTTVSTAQVSNNTSATFVFPTSAQPPIMSTGFPVSSQVTIMQPQQTINRPIYHPSPQVQLQPPQAQQFFQQQGVSPGQYSQQQPAPGLHWHAPAVSEYPAGTSYPIQQPGHGHFWQQPGVQQPPVTGPAEPEPVPLINLNVDPHEGIRNVQQPTISAGWPQGYPPYPYPYPYAMYPHPSAGQAYGYPMYPQLNVSEMRNTFRGLKITDLKLKCFTGDYNDYHNFRSSFEKLHSDYDVTEKFEYLKDKLVGAPLDEIKHLANNAANYVIAWKILDETYDNERYQLEQNLKKLFNLPKYNSRSISSIKAFKQELNGVENNLQAQQITWQDIVAYAAVAKMDHGDRQEFYKTLKPLKRATLPDLHEYIRAGEHAYSAMINYGHSEPRPQQHAQQHAQQQAQQRSDPNQKKKKSGTISQSHVAAIEAVNPGESLAPSTDKRKNKCFICEGEHRVKECAKFLNAHNREALLRDYKLCIYCLGHKFNHKEPCRTKDKLKCDICGKGHLAVLHTPASTVASICTSNELDWVEEACTLTYFQTNETAMAVSEVILPTATVSIEAKDKTILRIRCLLDQGSQSNYITTELVKTLKLQKIPTMVTVIGVGGTRQTVQALVNVTLQLRDVSLPSLTFKALVVPKITERLPAIPKNVDWREFKKDLADQFFNKPSAVQLLLGSRTLPSVFESGVEKLNGYLLQNTCFGWAVSGPGSNECSRFTSATVALLESVPIMISEFEARLLASWDIPMPEIECSKEDLDFVEKQFQEKHYRLEDGRYVVPTPWKKDAPKLGASYDKTKAFYFAQEARWCANPAHKVKSDEFMEEYISMGHMSLISDGPKQVTNGDVYYVPYISIMRDDALTTKLRNVFNASALTTTGVSLNAIIHPGPSLQTLIPNVLTQARRKKYMFSADVTKMFRQIQLLPEDANRIRIVWRKHRYEPLEEYKLNTITYGMDCAPYQAIRTLHQVAEDNSPDEETKSTIKRAFYMDDLLGGGHSIAHCQSQIAKISETLQAGKLPLTKWMSNVPEVLANVATDKCIDAYIDTGKPIKLLGLLYHRDEDVFSFNIKQKTPTFTKRGLLSLCAGIYDPLGWLLPFVMQIRMLIQGLWAEKYDWDDQIDEATILKFKKCLDNLSSLAEVRVPRWSGETDKISCDLVGFCDASGDGYAAVLYSRMKDGDRFRITLIAAKGHVTPLKSKVGTSTVKPTQDNGALQPKINNELTIPKLELEALVLLINLYNGIAPSFEETARFTCYSDSEIVIAWIRNQKDIDNKFVKRRVANIRKVIHPAQLSHVRTLDNPADYPSRGLSADQMRTCNHWFEGPAWLQDEKLPFTPFREPVEVAINVVTNDQPTDVPTQDDPIISRFSSWTRLFRTVATMLRWKLYKSGTSGGVRNGVGGDLTVDELIYSKRLILRMQQRVDFGREIDLLLKGKPLPKKSSLTTISAYLDDSQLLRVGGRLDRNKDLTEGRKHPIIMKKGYLMDLIIRNSHIEHGHGGASFITNLILQQFWLAAAKQRVKKIIRECTICIRWKGMTLQPIMSDLPAERTTIQPVFSAISLDLAGPFTVRASRLKFDTRIKIYVLIFVCQLTRMTHLEVCQDLSTDEFMHAWVRFCSRRGTPSLVLSDNATQLVAASKILKESWEKIKRFAWADTASNEVRWIFSPPRAPHFNGASEAMVRTFKYFIKRMTSIDNLRLDEFVTLTCKIEGFMNSRPLYSLSPEAGDPVALTPFMLCHQRELKCSPHELAEQSSNPLTRRFHQMQALQRDIWTRFKDEYLVTLQKRFKWKFPTRNAKVGDIVIVKDLMLKPSQWPLGIVLRTLPDEKGVIRKVEVKTTNRDIVPRATCHLIPLLTEAEATSTVRPAEVEPEPTPTAQLDPNTTEKTTRKSARLAQKAANAVPPAEPVTEPTPVLRRSTRPRKTVNLMTQFILQWLLIVSLGDVVAGSARFEPLSVGTHLIPIREIAVHGLDLSFTLKTSVNITSDICVIRNLVTKFKDFCQTHNGKGHEDITAHCFDLSTSLEEEAGMVETRIRKFGADTRTHRSIPAIAWKTGSVAASVIGKHLPEIVTAAGMAYLTYENVMLADEIQEVKAHTVRISQLAFKLNEVEYEHIGAEMDQLRVTQQLTILMEEITAYATQLQLVLAGVTAKYAQLKDLRPMAELTSYLQATERFDKFQLPFLTETTDVFSYNAIRTEVQQEHVILHYTIPLVIRDTFREMAVAQVPQANGNYTSWGNNELVQRIGISNDLNLFFHTREETELFKDIFAVQYLRPIDSCLQQLIALKSPTLCSVSLAKTQLDVVFPREGFALIYEHARNWAIRCGSSSISIDKRPAWVSFPNCSLVAGDLVFHANYDVTATETAQSTHLNQHGQIPSINADRVPEDGNIKDARRDLKEAIDNYQLDSPSKDQRTFFTFLYAVVPTTLMVIFVLCWLAKRKWTRRHRVESSWLAQWTAANLVQPAPQL